MRRYSVEEKAMWVEDWQGSGKSAWSYAKANGINPQTFRKWTKAGKEANKAGFVEIEPKVMPAAENRAEIVIEKGDIKIHIRRCELRMVMEELGLTK